MDRADIIKIACANIVNYLMRNDLKKEAVASESLPALNALLDPRFPLRKELLSRIVSLGSAHGRSLRGLTTRPAAILKYQEMLKNNLDRLLSPEVSQKSALEASKLINFGSAAQALRYGAQGPKAIRESIRSIGDIDLTPGSWQSLADKLRDLMPY